MKNKKYMWWMVGAIFNAMAISLYVVNSDFYGELYLIIFLPLNLIACIACTLQFDKERPEK